MAFCLPLLSFVFFSFLRPPLAPLFPSFTLPDFFLFIYFFYFLCLPLPFLFLFSLLSPFSSILPFILYFFFFPFLIFLSFYVSLSFASSTFCNCLHRVVIFTLVFSIVSVDIIIIGLSFSLVNEKELRMDQSTVG